MHLPDTDGGAVLETLKSDPVTSDIPVVIISADVSEGGVQRLLALGAVAYLTKPVDIEELTRVLGELDESEAGAGARSTDGDALSSPRRS